jgi:hypothetical protein
VLLSGTALVSIQGGLRGGGDPHLPAGWLHQAQADLELAVVSAAAEHHEWACFGCHQGVVKALKALHLRHGHHPSARPWWRR